MGRRSRKRGDALAAPQGVESARPPARGRARPARARPPAATPRRGGRRRLEDRPKPPWHPFPLVELCVLIGIVLLVLGALDFSSDRGKLLLLAGMALGSLGGLDTAVREHMAGYRSHTTALSALPGVLAAAALFFARAPWPAVVAAAVVVFAGAFWPLRRAYVRRARG